MRLRINLLFALLLPFILLAQSAEEDEVKFQAATEWLDSKLNYIYYDSEGEHWWKNTFYVNENKEVTIKHIVSDKPNTANIADKTYTIRTFQIQDINPHSLEITEINDSRGRIVKGQMLELRTFGFKDQIHKTINGRRASSTSFLFLSFPEAVVDSLANYAEVVKTKFEEAIWASTQVYPTNYEHDVEAVLSILNGSFQSDAGAFWKTEGVQPHVLKLDRGNGTIEYFGYDNNDHKFYLLTISAQGISEKYLDLKNKDRLILVDDNDQEVLSIQTRNSFVLNGQEFFRQ